MGVEGWLGMGVRGKGSAVMVEEVRGVGGRVGGGVCRISIFVYPRVLSM